MVKLMTELSAEEHQKQSNETLAVIRNMEAALAAGSNAMSDFFHDSFRWIGNYGCGTKEGLQAFRDNWQLPLRAAFTEREYKTDKFLADGEWASCFGHIEATHSGLFMGVEATHKRVTIPYMDFWKVEKGRISNNWVMVDFPHVMQQLGVDPFHGHGWEKYDRGEATPPGPDHNL